MMKATIFFIVYFILVASYAGATRNCKGLNHDDLEVNDIVAANVFKILDSGSTGGIGPQTYVDDELTYEFVVAAGKSPFGHLKIHEWYKPDDEEYNEKKSECKTRLNHDDLEVNDIVAANVFKILDSGSTGGIGPQTYVDDELTYEFVVVDGKSPFGHLKIHEWYKPDDEEYNEKKDLIEKNKSECGTSSVLQVNDIVGAKLSETMNDENEVDIKYRFVKEYGVSPFGSTPYFVRITPEDEEYELYKDFVDETDPE